MIKVGKGYSWFTFLSLRVGERRENKGSWGD